MRKLSLVILRVGIGAVIIWFASRQIADPPSWVFYLPSWTVGLPVSQIGFIYLNVWFELIFGTLMILGFYTRIVAFLLAIHMFGIVSSIGYNETGVRDFGIAIALLSISLYGTSSWSVDEYFEKRNNEKLKNQ